MHNHYRHPARHATPMASIRDAPLQPDVVPRDPSPLLEVPSRAPTLVPRAPESDESGSDESSSSGEKPTSTTTTTTLPVVLGAVVPIVIAIIILIYLHRRNVRKLRNEDANDKHRSLDFGMDIVEPSSKGEGPMQEAEKGARVHHTKGVSLDVGHPYLLPPGLHESQDSFNPFSRSVGGEPDRYRHAVSILAPESPSVRSHSKGFPDDTSSFAGSTYHYEPPNAQRMSHASPMASNAPPADHNNDNRSPVNHIGLHFDFAPSTNPSPGPVDENQRHSAVRSSGSTAADLRKSNAHLASAIHRNSVGSDPFKHPDEPEDSDHSSVDQHSLHEPASTHRLSDSPVPQQAPSMQPPRISLPISDAGSDYSNYRQTTATIPAVNISGVEDIRSSHEASRGHPEVKVSEEAPRPQNQNLDTRRDTRRMTFGLRPLPPEDPSDNPEQRANRIRSFYKEYFDENKTGRETYYEDYGPEYYPYADEEAYDDYDDYYFDPVPAPFAEPVTRRAMTPPPRAPPRFQGHMGMGSASGFSGFSSGMQSPGPRAFSSASNRMPGPPRAPRKPMPPPAPLNILPTPHMLKDDAIMSAIDFAPGMSFRDQKEGRPETPLGGKRPFSPMTRAATPLASSFDELAAMPSPHALRKSGAYSNLDFAPPPKFKTSETASDAGSIRSNGTGGISNTHQWNIRTGAYRVSRLPTDTVGTKDDMAFNLRPKWDMRT